MSKIVSRGLGTSLAFDDEGNASDICLQHISPCCYTESPKIFFAKIFVFEVPPPPPKMSDNDEIMFFTETFPTEI